MLPVALGALVVLGLLSSLALQDAVREWRVAALAGDELVARAALHEGIDAVGEPPDLRTLCVLPPLMPQARSGVATGGGRYHVTWSHLGAGVVRAVVEGVGRQRARARAVALVRPDSLDAADGWWTCTRATRLVPAGGEWLAGHPLG